MLLKACADCGEPTEAARCTDCRPRDTKPSATSRGYDSAWAALSRRARRLQPFCTDCGTTENLTTDHSPEAWRRKEAGLPIRLEDVDVVCRSCNARRGAARPGRVDPPRPPSGPPGKAESASLLGRDPRPILRFVLCGPLGGLPRPPSCGTQVVTRRVVRIDVKHAVLADFNDSLELNDLVVRECNLVSCHVRTLP